MLVALKKMSKSVIEKLEAESSIINEIATQLSLNSLYVIQLYNYFADRNNIYISMELASEGELFEIQRKNPEKKFSEEEAAAILKNVLEGVEAIHRKGFIHADLKPENILISLVKNFLKRVMPKLLILVVLYILTKFDKKIIYPGLKVI